LTFALLILSINTADALNFEEEIVLGEAAWPGIESKNAVVAYILESIGYDVKQTMLDVPMVLQGLANRDVDIWLGGWIPGEKPIREGLEGEFEVVRTHLEDAIFITAVPEYVWEAGVRCHSDLEEYADKFDHALHLGPVGEGGDEVLRTAAEQNIYELGNWSLVNASWPATIVRAEEAIENEEWIAFPGWKPHWMNVLLDIRYLEDPEEVWGGAEERIETLVRHEFEEEHPNLYTFLENFKITSEMQSEWIFAIDREDKTVSELAEDWIRKNINVVDLWLFGVKAEDGRSARYALRDRLNIN